MIIDQKKLNDKIKKAFPMKIVKKGYVHSLRFLNKFPTYVGEFLISQYADNNGELQKDARNEFISYLKKFAAEKRNKEKYKSNLIEFGKLDLIEHYKVFADLNRGKYFTQVEILDEQATINRDLLKPGRFRNLLSEGLWGKASLEYSKGSEFSTINMYDFEPYQSQNASIRRYIKKRKKFSSQEWLDLLLRTIGMDPSKFDRREKLLYITRLIPIVEKCTNSLELGPPGTGKSYGYENISEFSRMILGGDITPAKLIYNQNLKKTGFVFSKDLLCFDEINKKNRALTPLIPKLQQIMASNRVERGDLNAMTDVSIVFQGNIKLTAVDSKLIPENEEFMNVLPKDMYNCAFLDRLHIFIHGWELKRFSEDFINQDLGLISNYFGHILHNLRSEDISSFLINENVEIYKLDSKGKKYHLSIRDQIAIHHTISGFIKLLYPDKKLIIADWDEITKLAVKFRQNIIDEMAKIDPYQKRTLKYELIKKKKRLTKGEIKKKKIENKEEDEIIKKIEDQKEEKIKPAKKDLSFIFPTIYVDNNNYLTKPIPYWMLKVLMGNNGLKLNNSNNFLLKLPENSNFNVEKSDAPPIFGKEIKSQKVIKFDKEEKYLLNYNKKLKSLQDKVKKYSRNLNTFEIYFENIRRNIKNPEIKELYKKFEKIKSKLNIKSLLIPMEFSSKIEKELNGIEESAGKSPDLLKTQFFSIISDIENKAKKIDEIIQKWHINNKEYHKLTTPIIKTAINSGIDINSSLETRELYGGTKFPLFAFDVNNFVVSFKDIYKRRLRVDILFKKIKREILHLSPYRALFFASKYLKDYIKFFPSNDYNFWHIEKYKKGKRDSYGKRKSVDVDSNLTAITYNEIVQYHDQISTFYLGSGDKDLHIVVDKAKEFNIPVKVIVLNKKILSRELENLADEVISLY